MNVTDVSFDHMGLKFPTLNKIDCLQAKHITVTKMVFFDILFNLCSVFVDVSVFLWAEKHEVLLDWEREVGC